MHKCLDFIFLIRGGWDRLGFYFVNLELLPACVPPYLSFVVLGMFFVLLSIHSCISPELSYSL